MNVDIRKNLKQKILAKSPEFDLGKIIRSSYVRQVSESLQVSATDMAHAISSLLESPFNMNHYQEQSELQMKADPNLNTKKV